MNLLLRIAKAGAITVLCVVWTVATFSTALMAYESGSRLLWMCSAAFLAAGAMIVAFMTQPEGRLRLIALPFLWKLYGLFVTSFWLHKLLAYLQSSGK